MKYNYDMPYYFNTGDPDWSIENPGDSLVKLGPISIPYSFPMAQAANIIFGPNSSFALSLPYFQIPVGYHDYISTLTYFIWNSFQADIATNFVSGTVNISMEVALAAMSDSWRLSAGFFSFTNRTPQAIKENCDDYSWEQFYVPFWSLFNSKVIPTSNGLRNHVFTEMYDDIRKAPCGGPYRFGSVIEGNLDFTPEYGGNFRYFRNWIETHLGVSNAVTGYYNGNDYMILNNFNYLTSNTQLPFFHDLIDRYLDYTVPGTITQSSFNGNIINAFHSITASSTVQTNNTVDFRAGYEMTFKPGFHVEAGANFHAYIEPFTCVNGEYRNTDTDSTLATAYGFNEKFQFKNHGIIDYSNDESEEMTNEELEPEIDPSHVILVYPNPSDGKFSYLIPEKTDENIIQTVEVYNTIGDLVFSKQVNYSGQNVLDLGDVTTGIYIIKVISGEIVYSSKLMVE